MNKMNSRIVAVAVAMGAWLLSPQIGRAQSAFDDTGDTTTPDTTDTTDTTGSGVDTTTTPPTTPGTTGGTIGGTTGGIAAAVHPTVALSATPGTWVQAGVSEATQRQTTILQQHGGATPGPEPASFRTTLLNTILKTFFADFNDLLTTIASSLTGNALPPDLGGGGTTTPTTGPTIAANGRVWGSNQTTYQVTVTLTDNVDQATAATAANYAFGSVTATTAVLDNTLRIVTLTFGNTAISTSSTLTVSLQNIKDSSGETGAAVDTGAVIDNTTDTTPPTVEDVKLQTNTSQVAVTFSEVMDATSAGVQANYLSVASNQPPTTAVLGTDGRTVLLTFPTGMAGNTLRVSNNQSVKDINGNPAAQQAWQVPLSP